VTNIKLHVKLEERLNTLRAQVIRGTFATLTINNLNKKRSIFLIKIHDN